MTSVLSLNVTFATNPKVKICGITRSEDALLAAELGAWAIGFVFYRRSSRAIEPGVAASLRGFLPAHVRSVGVFVNASIDEVIASVRASGVDTVQLHGEESPEYCRELKSRNPELKLIKAIRVQGPEDLDKRRDFDLCEAVLFDSYVVGQRGGTGQTFDWSLANHGSDHGANQGANQGSDGQRAGGPPLILSGGLRPDNIAEAVGLFRPFAVDVSSGVEARAGIKDEKALRSFFAALA